MEDFIVEVIAFILYVLCPVAIIIAIIIRVRNEKSAQSHIDEVTADYPLKFEDSQGNLLFINERKGLILFARDSKIDTALKCTFDDFVSHSFSHPNSHPIITITVKIDVHTHVARRIITMQYTKHNDEISTLLRIINIMRRKAYDKKYSEYDTYTTEIDMPKNPHTVKIIKSRKLIENNFIWRDENSLHLLPVLEYDNFSTENSYKKITFPLSSIEYFSPQGDLSVETNVKGSGGGSSITGAVLGGLIAGDVGAIIGSRKEVKIETEHIKHDTRCTVLSVITLEGRKIIKFDLQALQILQYLIPEKAL